MNNLLLLNAIAALGLLLFFISGLMAPNSYKIPLKELVKGQDISIIKLSMLFISLVLMITPVLIANFL